MYISAVNSLFKSIQKDKSCKLHYYPSKISIETGNICNLKCPLCPTNDEEQKDVEKGLLSFENFKIIFNKIKPFVKTIDLFSWGEPFLNKDISRMIRYIKESKPNVRIFIDSNLNAITQEQIKEIARSGVGVIKVSCDGVTQEVYEKYRIGGDVDKVLNNLRLLIQAKKELRTDKPKIIWKYLVFKHNENEVDKAREMAKSLGIEFEASGMRVDCGKEIFEKVEDSVQRDKDWIPETEEYNNYRVLEAGKTFCEKPWRTMSIDWTGDVVPCGAIYNCAKYKYGNLLKESFDDVWNSEKYVLARKVISNKIDESPDLICSICKKNGFQFF